MERRCPAEVAPDLHGMQRRIARGWHAWAGTRGRPMPCRRGADCAESGELERGEIACSNTRGSGLAAGALPARFQAPPPAGRPPPPRAWRRGPGEDRTPRLVPAVGPTGVKPDPRAGRNTRTRPPLRVGAEGFWLAGLPGPCVPASIRAIRRGHARPTGGSPPSGIWRGGRVVDRAGLENRSTCKRTVGSNPTLSASSYTSRTLRQTGHRAEWQVSWGFRGRPVD
jgi:hypothetical protein